MKKQRTANSVLTVCLSERDNRSFKASDPNEEQLSVVESGSWRSLYSGQLIAPSGRTNIFEASFFEGGDMLYIERFPFAPPHLYAQRIVIDLPTGKREERVHPVPTGGPITSYSAVQSGAVVGTQSGTPPARHVALTRAILPEFKELQRVAFSIPEEAEPDGDETGIVISADRQILVYAFGHTIVYRRTRDLAALWTQRIERDFYGTRTLAISANGSRVAAAVIDTTDRDRQKRRYVGIYDGKDGSPVIKLLVNGDQGVAVSPDSRLLAIGKRLPLGRDVELSAEIYDVASGRRIATAMHDRVPPGHYQILHSHFDNGENGLQFSSDGKYLITSGNNRIRVWEV